LLIYRSGKLPDVHRDPFDRLIAAHAMQAGCTVISPDPQLGLLGASRLW
jgi:PIN domain nuclease of toxin-antitoxin system